MPDLQVDDIIGARDALRQPPEGGSPIARAARGGINIPTPADFPRESPAQYQDAMEKRLLALRNEFDNPEVHGNDPAIKGALEREIADTERKLKIVPGAVLASSTAPARQASAQASAPPTWDEVLKMPEMKGLPHEKIEEARNQYFADVVAPQVPTEQMRAARAAFDADTKPGVLTRATRAIGEAVDHVKEKGLLGWVKEGISLSPETLDQLERGYRNLKMGAFAHGLTFDRGQLNVLDRIDQGEKVPEMEDAGGYQQMNPEQRQQYRAGLEKGYSNSLNTIVNEAKRQAELYQNPNAAEAIQAANKWEFKEAWKAFRKDPIGIVKDLSLSNAAQVVPMAGMGVVGAALKGVPGMMVGFAGGSFPVDYATSMIDYLNDQNVDVSDYKAVDAKMREPDFLKKLEQYATMHAAGVAVADATLGKVLKPVTGVGLGGAVKAVAGNVAKSVGTEMAGEAGGEVLATGQIKPGDVIAEGLAAGPTAVAGTAASTVAAARKAAAAAPAAGAPPAADAAPAALGGAAGVLTQGEEGAPVAAAGGATAGVEAIWSNNGTDQAVKVTGYLGKKVNEDWYAIEGSDAGVPASQLQADPAALDAMRAATPRKSEPVTGMKPMLADADAIFKAAKEKPGLIGTIAKAMRDLPEYKEATPAEQFNLDAAVNSIVADPNEIFRAATARPEILNTIARAAELTTKIEREPVAAPAGPAAAGPDVNAAVNEMTADPKAIFGAATQRPGVLNTVAAAAAEADKLAKKKGEANARSVRSDEGKVLEGGAAAGGGKDQSGQDLQRQAQAGPAADNAELRRGGDGEAGNQVAISIDEGAHAAASSPANDKPEPSKAQIEAGNAELGHAKLAGMDLSIENPAGSVRKDLRNTPPKWQTTMQDHYGYVKGTTGFDKDHVDVYVKTGTPEDFSGKVYVVNQTKADGSFDEHKVMVGYNSAAAAREAYQAHYEKGWDRGKSIVEMPIEDFKTWAYDKTDKGPKGGALPAAATTLPAKQQQLFVQRGQERFAVASLEDAAAKWNKFRDATGAGVSQIGEDALIVDQDGKVIGHISYNGKVWSGLPKDWKPGMKPLVGDVFKPTTLSGINERRKMKRLAEAATGGAAKAAKEPWQMTSKEYIDSFEGKPVKRTGFQNRTGTLQYAHMGAVEQALQLGKPVPARVVAEYPDIQRKQHEMAEFSRIAEERGAAPAQTLDSVVKPAPKKAAPKKELAKEAKPAVGQITDVGEKIGGARKDWRDRGLTMADLEAMTGGEEAQHVVKSNIWKPDYSAMVKAGATPEVAASVKAVYDGMAAQPKKDTPEERRLYLATMEKVRAVYEGLKTIEDFKGARDKLMKALGVADTAWWKSAEIEKSGLFSVYKGRREPFSLNHRQRRKIAEVVAAGFPDAKVKRAAAAAGDDGKLPSRPHLDSLEREGTDYRKGKNVSAEDFMKAFGFRGVEFGNWAANDERQKHVDQAFDALQDLADVLGVPPRAIALNGTIGLAFGARGSGKAAAHYEPGKLVINITKVNGPGSLAHEWGHALDHYLGELDQPNAYQGHARGASGWYRKDSHKRTNLRPEMAKAFEGVMGAIFQRDRTKAEIVRRAELSLEQLQGRIDQQTERLAEAKKSEQTPERKDFIKRLEAWLNGYAASEKKSIEGHLQRARGNPDDATFGKTTSSYYQEAQDLSGKSGATGYWARPTELFARAFESYLFDQLERSDYLVHGVEGDRYTKPAYKGNPYPAGAERTAINKAFADLFETMETKTTPQGVAAFSRAQAQTKTPAFKKWFGKSKVVDDNGKPLVVYHGTNADFDSFSEDYFGENTGTADWGDGFYFTNDPAIASSYAKGDGANVKPIYLSMKNPARKRTMLSRWMQDVLDDGMGFESAQEALEGKGYDGIIFDHPNGRGREYVVFRPEQIKSAIGNRGTFDPNSDDISLSRAAGGRGLQVDQVRRQANELTSTWVNKPDVVVMYDPADAPFDVPSDARGAHLGNTVYLFTKNLHSAADVQFTLFHEALGHYGLQGMMAEPELTQIYRNIALRNSNVRAAAKVWMGENEKPAGWTDAEYRAQAIEEALADLAGKGETITGVGKLLAYVQRWLRDRGFTAVADWLESLSQAEALSVLAQARDFVLGEQGQPAFADQGELVPSLSREGEKPTFAEMVRELATGKGDRRMPLTVAPSTVRVLELVGMKQHPVIVTGSVIEKVLFDHAVPMPTVNALPELIADPVMIFASDTVPGDFVIVTDKVVKGLPLVVTMRPDGDINRAVVNVVTSAYGRQQPERTFKRWIGDNLALYENTSKRPAWQRSLGLQLPGKMPSRGAGVRVLTQADLVKPAGGDDTSGGGKVSLSRAPAAAAASQTAQRRTYRQVADAVINRIDRALDPILGLPDRDAYLKARHVAQGIVDNVGDIGRSIYDTFAKASDADAKASYDYLTTQNAKPEAIKDQAVRDHAVKTKGMIDSVGQELVKRGLLAPETFEAHRGAYLPRVYLKHMLEPGDWARIGSGRKPSQMGYLKQRKDIPAEVREVLLGEIKDPGYLSAVGFTRAMRDMALLDWLSQISKNGKWVLPKSLVEFNGHKVTPYWLKSEATRLRAQAEHMDAAAATKAKTTADAMDKAATKALEGTEFDEKQWKQIPDTARYGRLRGLVVRKEIYDDIVGIGAMVPPDAGWAEKLLGYGGLGTKATQLWKASKVSLNPPSQVRNFVSNAVLLQLSGVPMYMVPARLAQAAAAIRNDGPAWQTAKKHGLKASTFSAQELFTIEREMLAMKTKQSGSALMKALSVAATVMKFAGDWYQKTEALFKTAKIIDEMARGKKAEDAVLEANKWLFDYSRVSPSVRYLRNAPIGAPFITFMAKVAPRLVEVALKHPQRYLPYAVLAWGLPMAVASMLGVGTDDLDKLKKLLPESWQTKGHVFVLPYKDENGRWQVLDLSYFFPWAQFDQMARQVAKGDVIGATKSAGIFGGPIPDIITAWKTNKDPFTGREIVKKGAPPALQLGGLLTYAMDMALPPWLSSKGLVGFDFGDPNAPAFLSGKAVRALEGSTNRFGDQVTTPAQAALSLAGVNVRGVDPKTDRAVLLQAQARGIQDTRTELKRSLEDRSLSAAQREHAKGIYVDEMKRRTEKLRTIAEETKVPPALQ